MYGGPSVACFLFTSRRNLRHVAGGSTVVPKRGTTEFLRRASTLHRVPVVNAHATRTNDSLIHDSAGSAFILHRPFIYLLLVCHFPRRSNHDFFCKAYLPPIMGLPTDQLHGWNRHHSLACTHHRRGRCKDERKHGFSAHSREK